MTYLLGLTGGIASGKSTVSRTFKAAGFPVVDADVIARQIVEPGQPVLARIAQAFGPEVLRADGSLDRAKLAKIVFPSQAEWQP
ncbi:dephospho-CoA kinase [Lacticaseibacillus paracasei]|nr:dephospho-CoA kinase [Lacticaseibacillus paracasei]